MIPGTSSQTRSGQINKIIHIFPESWSDGGVSIKSGGETPSETEAPS